MPSTSRRTRRRAVTVTGVAVLVAVAGLFLGRAIVLAREEARFTRCRNNLRQITHALHSYHDIYGSFPPAVTLGPDGKPWHSWRVLLVPYLEASPFWSRYRLDEPWDSPHNREVAAEFRTFADWNYRCPSDVDAARETTSGAEGPAARHHELASQCGGRVSS